MHHFSARLLALIALMLGIGLGGCGGIGRPASQPQHISQLVAAPLPTEAPQPTSATNSSGNGALFAISGEDGFSLISRLSKDGWQAPSRVALGACQDNSNLFADASGAIWAVCSYAYKSSDQGRSWQQVVAPFQNPEAQISGAAIDSHDRVWLMTRDEIVVLSAKDNAPVIAYTARATTHEQYFPTGAVAVAKDGALWLGGFNLNGSTLVSFDGTGWTAYGKPEDLGIESYVTPLNLYLTPDQRLQFVADNRIYELQNRQFRAIGQTQAAIGNIRRAAEAGDGTLLLATLGGLARWDKDQISAIGRADGLPSSNVHDVAVDRMGRAWVATDYGIAVQDRGAWRTATPSDSGLGSSRVYSLLVQGAPALPPATSDPRTAIVTGRIVEDGQPIAHAKVQLCSEPPRLVASASPCEGFAIKAIVETAADGAFAFRHVPLATYGIAVTNSAGRWQIFLSTIYGHAGSTVNLGSLAIAR